jgi:hypothetical protein
MREDSAHARNHDFSAAAEIFASGTYFPNTLRIRNQDLKPYKTTGTISFLKSVIKIRSSKEQRISCSSEVLPPTSEYSDSLNREFYQFYVSDIFASLLNSRPVRLGF